MQSRNFCFGVVALAFLCSAYAQAPAPVPVRVAPVDAAVSGTAETANNPDPTTQKNIEEAKRPRSNDAFVAPPMRMEIKEEGISLPKCVSESKEGKGCED